MIKLRLYISSSDFNSWKNNHMVDNVIPSHKLIQLNVF